MESVRCPVVVGRDSEMESLRIALAGAEAGRGSVVVLAGEAGVGKSRLLGELAEVTRTRGGLAVTGRAAASGAASPFRPLSEALLQALRARELTSIGLGPWSAALRSVIPVQASDAVGPAAAMAEILPTARGEAVVRLLRALAGTTGLLVGLEDLQWADPDTLAVVEYLADNLQTERVLCIGTVRPEPGSPGYELVQSLEARRSVRLVSLARLSVEQTRQMVLACRPAVSGDVVRYVVGAADGVPFLVEELLASPGVPASFAAAVTARLAGLDEAERRVIQIAAVLGRHFDWRLLTASADEPQLVGQALEHAVGSGLLEFHGDAYQFRHALTREAILDTLLPHVRAELSQAALAAVQAGRPGLTGASRDLAAELALQAGDTELAARLLTESGRESLRRGALATAASTLRRASNVAEPDRLRHTANALLAEALALAGRVDECMSVSAAALRQSATAGPSAQAQIHLAVAHAAVEATRWPVAADHLASAERLLEEDPDPALRQRWRVLAAETALSKRDVAAAQRLAELVLESALATADVRCHALGLLGRSHRARDLEAARVAFEKALTCAEMANLPLWRLRALHELGTIELFEQAGTRRLEQARQTADDLGALSTAAVLDIQLAAAYLFRFDPEAGKRHAASALAAAERLHLTQLRATALVFLAELAGLRRDVEEMESHDSLALAAAPGDTEIEMVRGGRGIAALLDGNEAGACQAFQRAVECLAPLPNSGPGIYLGLWPLLLAVHADAGAGNAISSARRTGMTVNRANRGMLLYAEAVLAGRRPDRDLAAELADRGAAELAHFPVWSDLARMLTARAALADGWGEPQRWLTSASRSFGESGLEPLVQRCHALLAEPAPDALALLGVTPRETEVLDLVTAGLSNKDIAARLHLSHRTVEKHIESLLRKTGARSRTQLATARAGALRPRGR